MNPTRQANFLAAMALGVPLGWLALGAVWKTPPAVEKPTAAPFSLLQARNSGQRSGRPFPKPDPKLSPFHRAGAEVQAVLSASAEQLRLWAEAGLRRGEFWYDDSSRLIMTRWAELDPQRAWAFATEAGEDSIASLVLTRWAATDLETAFAAALQAKPMKASWTISPGPSVNYVEAWRSLLGGGDADQERLFDLAVKAGFEQSRPRDFDSLLSALARTNPTRAAELALQKGRLDLASSIAGNWAEKWPESAMRWAESLGSDEAKRTAVEAAAGAMVRRDGLKGLEALRDRLTPSQLANVAHQLAPKWEDTDSALQWVRDHGDSPALASVVVSKLAQLQSVPTNPRPERIAEIAALLPATEANGVSGGTTLWMKKDPAACQEWLNSLPEGSLKKAAYEAALQAMPKERVLAMLRAEDPAVMSQLNSGWLGDYFSSGISQVLRSLSTEEFRALPSRVQEHWLETYARNKVWSNLPEMARLVSESTKGQEGAAEAVAASWASKDPQAAAKWVAGLESESARGRALGSLVDTWSQTDPRAASAWIAGLHGTDRDFAVARYLKANPYEEPDRVLELAASISESAWREETLQNVIKGLAGAQPDEALRRLATANLPPHVAASVRQSIEREQRLRASLRSSAP